MGMKTIGVYCILNTLTNTVYFGHSDDIHRRWSNHRSCLRRGVHQNKHLQNAYTLYGADAFIYFVVRETDTVHKASDVEQDLLTVYAGQHAVCYNIAKDSTAFARGYKHTDESKRKIAERNYRYNPGGFKPKTHHRSLIHRDTGEIIQGPITCITRLATERSLMPQHLHSVLIGKRKSHKGWSLHT